MWLVKIFMFKSYINKSGTHNMKSLDIAENLVFLGPANTAIVWEDFD